MSYPDLTYRSELPPVTRKELEQFAALLQAYLSREHNSEGQHTNITADSITVRAGGEIRLEGEAAHEAEDALISLVDGVGKFSAPNIELEATDCTVEVLTAGVSRAEFGKSVSNAGIENQVANKLAVLGALRLAGQDVYTPAANDTDAFPGDSSGPLYSFYRATPSADRTIDGISVNLAGGGRGHVLVVVNDSAFALTFNTIVVANAKKILGDPVTIGQDGAVILVYDNANTGWRIVSSFAGSPIDYTPTWTGDVSNPAIGDGSISGKWQQVGRVVHYQIIVVIGSSTTLGTGAWKFGLPTASSPSDSHVAGSALITDAGTAHYLGVPRVSSDAIYVHTPNEIGPATPHVWANTDAIRIAGTYLRS
jgi:hypothetical protein